MKKTAALIAFVALTAPFTAFAAHKEARIPENKAQMAELTTVRSGWGCDKAGIKSQMRIKQCKELGASLQYLRAHPTYAIGQ